MQLYLVIVLFSISIIRMPHYQVQSWGVFICQIENFSCLLSDGITMHELIENGNNILITNENALSWISLYTETCLNEGSNQIISIRNGLSSIIPNNIFHELLQVLIALTDLQTDMECMPLLICQQC